MDPIIVVDGDEFKSFQALVSHKDIYKLSVHVDGERVMFKLNEHMWSLPMGHKRKDY